MNGMISKRSWVLAGTAVLACGAAVVGGKYLRQRNLAHGLERIGLGQDEAAVGNVMGKPDRTASPRPSHWWDTAPVAVESATADDSASVKQWQYDDWPWARVLRSMLRLQQEGGRDVPLRVTLIWLSLSRRQIRARRLTTRCT